MGRTFFVLGALLAGVGVALGAFGAHGLRGRLEPELLEIFETGVRYQLWHALALLAVGWTASRRASPTVSGAGWLFVLGIALFSGSLYLLSLTGVRALGAITPFGGGAFLAGWALLAWGALTDGERTATPDERKPTHPWRERRK